MSHRSQVAWVTTHKPHWSQVTQVTWVIVRSNRLRQVTLVADYTGHRSRVTGHMGHRSQVIEVTAVAK